jgi:hypothetical protein
MTRPNIQIDDLVREMSDDEYAAWLADGGVPIEDGGDE